MGCLMAGTREHPQVPRQSQRVAHLSVRSCLHPRGRHPPAAQVGRVFTVYLKHPH